MLNVARGQIWMVDLTPQTFKAEPGKRERPCLVIQTDILNQLPHATTVIIPGSTQIYRDENGDGFPLKVQGGMIQKPGDKPQETDFMIDQIRAISNERFMGAGPVGNLSRTHLKRVDEAMKIVLGL